MCVFCFYHHFTKCEHKEELFKPLFPKVILNARKLVQKSNLQRRLDKEKKAQAARSRLYFHLECHNQNSSLQNIQDFFLRMVFNTKGKKPFNKIVSGRCGVKVPVNAMITANHRANILGDLLSIRNI